MASPPRAPGPSRPGSLSLSSGRFWAEAAAARPGCLGPPRQHPTRQCLVPGAGGVGVAQAPCSLVPCSRSPKPTPEVKRDTTCMRGLSPASPPLGAAHLDGDGRLAAVVAPPIGARMRGHSASARFPRIYCIRSYSDPFVGVTSICTQSEPPSRLTRGETGVHRGHVDCPSRQQGGGHWGLKQGSLTTESAPPQQQTHLGKPHTGPQETKWPGP